MSVKYKSVLDLIGNTPIVPLHRLTTPGTAEVFVKLESVNIGGSVKDRIALHMILCAEKSGEIHAGDTLIEASSGNTGIGVALIAAVKGYRAVIVMPDNVSIERVKLMRAYGAEVILTPKEGGIKATFDKVDQLVEIHGYHPLRQFENPANPEIHRLTTAREIVSAFDGKTPTAFVAGVGTGGTITGVGEYLKEVNPSIEIIAVEPSCSAVLSGGPPGPHMLQGIGTGTVPAILNTASYDRVVTVDDEAAMAATRALAREEGILTGYSGGAAVAAALSVAASLTAGESVLAIIPDNGMRYLSTSLFDNPA